ncbi:MAG: hypothetical protein ACKV2O_19280 [Acidimicrobiales bacterium]
MAARDPDSDEITVIIDEPGPPDLTPRLARSLLRAMVNVDRQRRAVATDEAKTEEASPPALAS